MECWSCGAEIPHGSNFCGLCGGRQNPKDTKGEARRTQAMFAWTPKTAGVRGEVTLVNTPAIEPNASADPNTVTSFTPGARPGVEPAGDTTAGAPAPVRRFAALAAAGHVSPRPATPAGRSPTSELVLAVRRSGEMPAVRAAARAQAAPPSGDEVEAPAEPAEVHEPSVILAPDLAEARDTLQEARAIEAPATLEEISIPEPVASAPSTDGPGLRETNWFMDALDPEALSAIETDDIERRREHLAQARGPIADDVRRRFSLESQNELPTRDQMTAARDELAAATAAGASRASPNAALVVGVLAAVAAAAWWLFR